MFLENICFETISHLYMANT